MHIAPHWKLAHEVLRLQLQLRVAQIHDSLAICAHTKHRPWACQNEPW